MDPRKELELRRAAVAGDERAELELRRELIRQKPKARDVGTMEAVARSAMGAFQNIGEGAGLTGRIPSIPSMLFPGVFGQPVDQLTQTPEQLQALREQHPIASAIGESAPYLAGGLLTGGAMSGMGLAANLAGQAGTAGAIGFSQPGSLSERVQRGAVDAALGAAGEGAGRLVGRVVAPQLAPRAMATSAEELGYGVLPSTRAQGVGQKFRQVVEGGLEASSGGGRFAAMHEGNQALLNRAAAESIGEVAEAPTDTVLASARARIGDTFGALLPKGKDIPVDDAITAQVDEIADKAISPFIRGEADPIGTSVKRLQEHLAKGSMDAGDLMALQSRLGKQGRQALRGENSNPELGHALLDMQEALLDLARRNMSPEEAAAFTGARQQYRNLMTLESGQNIDPVTGQVYPGRIANFLQRRDRRGFLEGGNRSPFYEGVRFMAREQKPLPTSGTAERSFLREALRPAYLGVGGALGGAQYSENDVAGGAAGAALGLVAPYAAARAYLSPAMRNAFTRAPGATEQAITRGVGIGATRSMAPQGKDETDREFNERARKVEQEMSRASPAIQELGLMAEGLGATNLARRLSLYQGTSVERTELREEIARMKDRAERGHQFELADKLRTIREAV